MRSSDDAAGGGKATVCAAADRHQHAAHVLVTRSVRKRSSFVRTAYATPGGFLPPDRKTSPQSTTAQTGGYRAWRGRVKAEGPARRPGATFRVPPLPELPGQSCHPGQISYFTGACCSPAAGLLLGSGLLLDGHLNDERRLRLS